MAQTSTDTCLISRGLRIQPIDTTVCKRAEVRISVLPLGFQFADSTRFQWLDSKGTILSDSASLLAVNISSQKYICIITEGNCSDTLRSSITIADSIFLPIMASSTLVCQGVDVILHTKPKSNHPLEWTRATDTDFSCFNSPLCDSVRIRPKTTFTYSFSDQSTCYYGQPIRIEVVEILKLKAPTEFLFCIGTPKDTITLNPNPLPGVKYEWTQPGNPLFSSTKDSPRVYPFENTRYRVKLSKSGCTGEDDVLVIIGNQYQVSTVADTIICPNTPVKLNFSINLSSSSYRYKWNPGGFNDKGNDIVVSPSSSTNYVLELEYGAKRAGDTYFCPVYYDTVKVLVLNTPILKIVSSPKDSLELALGKVITLKVEPVLPVAKYTWALNGKILDSKMAEIKVPLRESGTYTVSITDAFGCVQILNSGSYVAKRPDVRFPTIFDPSAETYRPFYSTLTEGLVKIEKFYILNRWGQAIYELKSTQVLDDNFKGWDGKKEDAEVPSDVYVVKYFIRFADERFEEGTLDLTLIR